MQASHCKLRLFEQLWVISAVVEQFILLSTQHSRKLCTWGKCQFYSLRFGTVVLASRSKMLWREKTRANFFLRVLLNSGWNIYHPCKLPIKRIFKNVYNRAEKQRQCTNTNTNTKFGVLGLILWVFYHTKR